MSSGSNDSDGEGLDPDCSTPQDDGDALHGRPYSASSGKGESETRPVAGAGVVRTYSIASGRIYGNEATASAVSSSSFQDADSEAAAAATAAGADSSPDEVIREATLQRIPLKSVAGEIEGGDPRMAASATATSVRFLFAANAPSNSKSSSSSASAKPHLTPLDRSGSVSPTASWVFEKGNLARSQRLIQRRTASLRGTINEAAEDEGAAQILPPPPATSPSSPAWVSEKRNFAQTQQLARARSSRRQVSGAAAGADKGEGDVDRLEENARDSNAATASPEWVSEKGNLARSQRLARGRSSRWQVSGADKGEGDSDRPEESPGDSNAATASPEWVSEKGNLARSQRLARGQSSRRQLSDAAAGGTLGDDLSDVPEENSSDDSTAAGPDWTVLETRGDGSDSTPEKKEKGTQGESFFLVVGETEEWPENARGDGFAEQPSAWDRDRGGEELADLVIDVAEDWTDSEEEVCAAPSQLEGTQRKIHSHKADDGGEDDDDVDGNGEAPQLLPGGRDNCDENEPAISATTAQTGDAGDDDVEPFWALPGALYIYSSGTGQALAWDQTCPARSQAQATENVPGVGRESSLLSSLDDGSAGSYHHGSSSQIVVEVAELAPGEMERVGGALDTMTTSTTSQSVWHVDGDPGIPSTLVERGGLNNSSLVLEAVPVPFGEERTTGRRGGGVAASGEKILSRNQKWLLCIVVAVLLAATAAIVATVLGWSPPAEAETTDAIIESVLTLSSSEALNDKLSPQYMALQWLSDNATMSDMAASQLLDNPPRLLQRYALAVLYYATGGLASWSEQLGFLSSNHECEWNYKGKGVKCNNASKVVMLDLYDNNLTGTLPNKELIALSSLEILAMSNNELGGEIPGELAALQSLQRLALHNNSFSRLTENVGDMKALFHLDVGHNLLSSTIPSSVGNLKLLKFLDLSINFLTGPIPSAIGNMSSLEVLRFHFNDLSSSIPSSWNALNELSLLNIDGNHLNGTLPVSPSANQKLVYLIAADNELTGTLPSSLGGLSQLRVMILRNNKLHGTIPETIFNLTWLEVLSLGSNTLSGTVPPEIFRSRSLRAINVGDNRVTGTLPSDIGNPRGILAVDVERNQITGTIPSTYGTLPSLNGLSLRSNLLTGTVPPSLGNNTRTIALMLENNMLSGTVPESLAELTEARWISLARNDLTGNINFFCTSNVSQWGGIFTADCTPPGVEVDCDCCICCNDDDAFGCNFHLDLGAYAEYCLSRGSCNNDFSMGELSWW